MESILEIPKEAVFINQEHMLDEITRDVNTFFIEDDLENVNKYRGKDVWNVKYPVTDKCDHILNNTAWFNFENDKRKIVFNRTKLHWFDIL